jgi:hypothetical protein
VASGCATAVDDSTASGACAPTARRASPDTEATKRRGATTTAGARGAATATLARTGADVGDLGASAVAATALGGVFLALGRRRQARA